MELYRQNSYFGQTQTETQGERVMQEYYSERAAEYDAVYAKPERQPDLAFLQQHLKERARGADVLEIACGTGYWTDVLATSATSILAIDSSEKMLEIARQRPQAWRKTFFKKDDAFALETVQGDFNLGFCGFFWSHIYLNRLQDFLNRFHSRLAPGADVIFIDNLYIPGNSTELLRRDEMGNTYQKRELADGRFFEVVKNYPEEKHFAKILDRCTRDWKMTRTEYFWILEYQLVSSSI